MSEFSGHLPVLLDRCIALLAPALTAPGAVVVDATLGLGGHSEAMLERFPDLTLVGIDRDPSALERSRARLAPFAARTTLVHAIYDELPQVLTDLGIPQIQGILLDLGVSSMQLDENERGFAYREDAPLDMRMDRTTGVTAAEVVNSYSVPQLTRVLRDYGEERFARRIAEAVVRERERAPITSTGQLAELVRNAIPAATRRVGGHPAKRSFQALRIEVNDELGALQRALPAALAALAVHGRIAVMSYQSLEDRLVKRALADVTTVDLPHGLPVIPAGHEPTFRLLTRGGEGPSDDEVANNPRSASVRLRAAERVREAA